MKKIFLLSAIAVTIATTAFAQLVPSRLNLSSGTNETVIVNWEYPDIPKGAVIQLERSSDGLNFTTVCTRTARPDQNRFLYIDDISNQAGTKFTYRINVTNGQTALPILTTMDVIAKSGK